MEWKENIATVTIAKYFSFSNHHSHDLHYRVSQKKVCFRNEQLAALQTTAGPGSPADESKNGHFHVYFVTGQSARI